MRTALWSPWVSAESDVRSMLERFERMLLDRDLPAPWRPLSDVYRKGDQLVVEIELPGVAIDDVDIAIDEDMLEVSGETHTETERDEEGMHISERRFGSFMRKIPLPDGVDPEKVEADYTDGVLTVRIPVPVIEAHEPKKIPIKTSEG